MFSSPISYIADKLVLTSPTTLWILLIMAVPLVVHLVVTFLAYPSVTRWTGWWLRWWPGGGGGRLMRLPPRAAPSWPLVGSLLSLVDDQGTPPYEVLARLAREHGPVFRFDFGSFPTVILSDAAVVHEAFAKSAAFADRPPFPMFFNYGQGIIANNDNAILRLHRRFYLSSLRSLMGKGKSHMELLLVQEINDLLARINARGGLPFDPYDDLAQTSANILCSVLFGKHYTLDDVIFKEMLENLKECYELAGHENERNFIPLLSYLPATKKARRAMEVCANIRALCRAFITDASKDYAPNVPRSYVDMYIDNFPPRSDENDSFAKVDTVAAAHAHCVDDVNLEVNIGDLMAAGTETSAGVASWGLLLLARHPKVQERMQRDIDAVVGLDRQPEYHDRSELPYVQAVVMEIMRFGSVTPLGVPHCVSSSTELAGYDIPRGMAVMANIWWIHNDPSVWKEPQLFNPERFLAEDKSIIRREHMMPFSVGRRRCIGEDLASMELFLLFSHLLARFTLHHHQPAGETTPISAAKEGITRKPCPYKITVTPRERRKASVDTFQE